MLVWRVDHDSVTAIASLRQADTGPQSFYRVPAGSPEE
jgi:hypothetical protein